MTAELEKIRQQRARAEQRLAALKSRESDLKRKTDTRKKIVLGGALLAAARRDPQAAEMITRLAREHMSERDRALFPSRPEFGTGGPIRIGPRHDQ